MDHYAKMWRDKIGNYLRPDESLPEFFERISQISYDNVFHGRWSREKYYAIWCGFQAKYPIFIGRYFKQRLDLQNPRPLGEFALTLLDKVTLELDGILKWVLTYGQLWYPGTTAGDVEMVSVETTGRLILFSKDRNFGVPDCLIQKLFRMDYKSNVCNWKITFKWQDLQEYRKYGGAILVGLQPEGFCYISAEMVLKICRDIENGVLRLHDWREVGDKEGVQFFFFNRSHENAYPAEDYITHLTLLEDHELSSPQASARRRTQQAIQCPHVAL